MKTNSSKRKAWWTLILVGLLASSPLFGGGGGQTAQPAEQPQIRWFANWSTQIKWSQDLYAMKEYSRQMDNAIINIEVGDSSKLVALIAAGDVPDLMFRNLNRTQALDIGIKGVLFPLETKFSQMPSINKWRKTYKEYDANMVAPDGHQYFTPRISGYPYWYSVPLISPVVKKYGIDPANGDIATFEDLYNIMKRLKQDYPDSYPWVTRRGFGRSYREGCQIFGTWDLFYLNERVGDYVYGPMEENYRLMVEYMARCYKEGLMHPDWFTMEEDPWRETMQAGKAFFTTDAMNQGTWMGGDAADPTTWWIPFLTPKFKGTQYYTTFQFRNVWPDPFFMVGAKSKNVDSIVKLIDWFYSDEGQMFPRFGKPGEIFTKTASGCYTINAPEGREGDKGQLQASEQDEWLMELGVSPQSGKYMFNGVVLLSGDKLRTQSQGVCPTEADLPLMDFTAKGMKMVEDNKSMMPPQPVLSFTDEEFDTLKQIETDIGTAAMENTIQFIRGLKPLSEWSNYIQELKRLGVDQALVIYRDANKRYQASLK